MTCKKSNSKHQASNSTVIIGHQIPSTKHQIPNKFQISNPNDPNEDIIISIQ
jgi:hypothetical protein